MLAPGMPPHDTCVFRYGREGESFTVTVYTLRGRKVRTLEAVTGEAVWDGRDEGGGRVKRGTYLFVARSSSGRQHGTVTVIR